MGVLIGCGVGLAGIFVGLLILSMIIRASVWIANKCVGGASGGGRAYYDDDDEDDWDAYDRPARRGRRQPSGAIPEPELFKGMGIGLVWLIAAFVLSLVLNIGLMALAGGIGGGPLGLGGGADPTIAIFVGLAQFGAGFLIWAGLLSVMLPTSFLRACLVTVFIYIISILISAVVVGAVVVVFGLNILR